MITLPFDATKPVKGQASKLINKPIADVFCFVAEQFFDNYPKWALEVEEFEPLDGHQIFIGARARQVRNDQGQKIDSVFQITDNVPYKTISFKGVTEPYRNTYLFDNENNENVTVLTFSFELLELDLFMRPFEKLIRTAIEEGAENTVENIRKLVSES